MQAISTVRLTLQESTKILSLEEGHFIDLKSKDISPGKLTKALSGFANAEGESCLLESMKRGKESGLGEGLRELKMQMGSFNVLKHSFHWVSSAAMDF
jgi:ATP-dependent DNA helicase RecG